MPILDAITALTRAPGELLPELVGDLQHEIDERMLRIPTRLNAYGYDPWVFHPDSARRALIITALLYRYWFRVEVHGIERMPPGRVLLISNHAGQIALDAGMIVTGCFLGAEPPRIVRGMGEYWLPRLPLLNVLMVRTGSVVGTSASSASGSERRQSAASAPTSRSAEPKLPIWVSRISSIMRLTTTSGPLTTAEAPGGSLAATSPSTRATSARSSSCGSFSAWKPSRSAAGSPSRTGAT